MRWSTVVTVAAASTLVCLPVAGAEPAVPQPNGSCAPEVSGAMTLPAAATAPLRCTDGRWQTVSDPYPFSDRWVSPGRPMTLRGGAVQNPLLEPGRWTAVPLSDGDRCRAEQVSVTYGKVDGPPRIDEGGAGERLDLEVIPRLLDIDMSGNCLWQKVSD